MTSIFYKFYHYQRVRFPVFLLLVSLLSVIVSSAAVVSDAKPDPSRLFLALLAAIAYILHIRIIDEHRDFYHDTAHHKDRPIQRGVISLKELKKIDFVMIFLILASALLLSVYHVGVAMGLLLYTYFAEREFFLGEFIRRHFFWYNAINIIQMLLLQIFVYSFFTKIILINGLIVTHFLFTGVGAVMLEFLRKIKTPDRESTGEDTYTWYLGFTNSIIIFVFLVLLDTALFLKITSRILDGQSIWLLFSALFVIIFLLSTAVHWFRRTRFTDLLFQLSSLFMYSFFNTVIYFLKF